MADVLRLTLQYDAAEAAYERALALDSERGRTHAGLGHLYMVRGEWEKALQAYQQAITLDPQDATVRCGLGDVYRQLQRNDEALQAYQRALRLNARLPAAYLGQGHVYRSLNRLYDAIHAFKRVVALDPSIVAGHVGMGEVYYEWQQLDDALACFEKALEIEPGTAAAHLGIGNIYRDRGETGRAIVPTRNYPFRAVRPMASSPTPTTRGETEGAGATRAVRHHPEDALSMGSLAGLYRKVGRQADYERTIEEARRLIAYESEYNRACLEAIAGNVQQAVELLDRALLKRQVSVEHVSTDPDFDFIRDDPAFRALLEQQEPSPAPTVVDEEPEAESEGAAAA